MIWLEDVDYSQFPDFVFPENVKSVFYKFKEEEQFLVLYKGELKIYCFKTQKMYEIDELHKIYHESYDEWYDEWWDEIEIKDSYSEYKFEGTLDFPQEQGMDMRGEIRLNGKKSKIEFYFDNGFIDDGRIFITNGMHIEEIKYLPFEIIHFIRDGEISNYNFTNDDIKLCEMLVHEFIHLPFHFKKREIEVKDVNVKFKDIVTKISTEKLKELKSDYVLDMIENSCLDEILEIFSEVNSFDFERLFSREWRNSNHLFYFCLHKIGSSIFREITFKFMKLACKNIIFDDISSIQKRLFELL